MQVSIIVPVLNEASRLPKLLDNLALLRASTEIDIELIIIDGGSGDQTSTLMHEADLCAQCNPGRARQMNHGAQLASGNLLVFLHADTLLDPRIETDWKNMLERNSAWGFSPVKLDHPASEFRIIEWCMNARSRLTKIATGDQVFCISREVFKRLDGFADIELMEDVELSGRLKKLGPPMIFSNSVVCSPRKWLKHGVVRTVLLMWCIRAAYFFGVSPARLHAAYYAH